MNSTAYRVQEKTVHRLYLALVLMLSVLPFTGIDAAQAKEPAGEASLVFLEGMVTRVDGGEKSTPLALNDPVHLSDRVRTGVKARAALELSGGIHLRLDELSEIRFDGIPAQDSPEARIRIMVSLGDVWIHAPARPGEVGGMDIRTPLAGIRMVRGIFRITVFSDSSALVKVYSGPIEVWTAEIEESRKTGGASSGKKKAWNQLVDSMQQIHIRSDGTATRPYQLLKKVDETPWVEWNRKLDNARRTSNIEHRTSNIE